MSPEMIDAAIIQLNTMIEVMPGIPDDVRATGKDFTTALDRWSEQKKRERAESEKAKSA
jgi:hypothetical protein